MSASVFPARAGMSPAGYGALIRSRGVPRASGDEPARYLSSLTPAMCSPRERG